MNEVVIDGEKYYPENQTPIVSSKWYDFLTSNRFWAITIGALSIYGEQKGFLGDSEMQLIATISSLFVVVRTLDRGAEVLSEK